MKLQICTAFVRSRAPSFRECMGLGDAQRRRGAWWGESWLHAWRVCKLGRARDSAWGFTSYTMARPSTSTSFVQIPMREFIFFVHFVAASIYHFNFHLWGPWDTLSYKKQCIAISSTCMRRQAHMKWLRRSSKEITGRSSFSRENLNADEEGESWRRSMWSSFKTFQWDGKEEFACNTSGMEHPTGLCESLTILRSLAITMDTVGYTIMLNTNSKDHESWALVHIYIYICATFIRSFCSCWLGTLLKTHFKHYQLCHRDFNLHMIIPNSLFSGSSWNTFNSWSCISDVVNEVLPLGLYLMHCCF